MLEELYQEYKFSSLVVGSFNQFAYSVSKAIIDNPGILYNPLIIYGNVGLGKTHLLHSIGHEVKSDDKTVAYSTFEHFFNDLRRNITANTMDYFRDKYRQVDFLLMDDIQFIANKVVLQEEFFNTFNDLIRLNKQIVLTCDRHPKELLIEERVKNRLEGGLIVEVFTPDIDTKKEIIKKKSIRNRLPLNDSSIDYIASNVVDNVRIIEGILLKIHAYSVLMEENITLEFVKNIVDQTKSETEKVIDIEKIVSTVSGYFNIKSSEIKSKSRVKNIVRARKIILYLLNEYNLLSMSSMANMFNMKDHSSVSYSIASAKKLIKDDKSFENDLNSILVNVKKSNNR